MEYTAFVVGIPSTTTWSTVTQLAHANARISVALTVRVTAGDPGSIGREIIHRLQTWIDAGGQFSDAVEYFAAFKVPDNSELVVWYSQGDSSLFAVASGVVGVVRVGTYFELANTQSYHCVQGTLFPGDTILLGTSHFQRNALQTLANAADPVETALKMDARDPALCGQVTRLPPIAHPDSTPEIIRPHLTRESARATKSPTAYWLLFSARQKKITALVLMSLGILLSVFLLQRFALSARARRIRAITAPLAMRLDTIERSSENRVEKERALAALVADTSQARTSALSDPGILTALDSFTIKLHDLYIATSKRKEIDHLPVFYDFRLITSDFVASQVQYDGPGKLAIFLDTTRGKIVSLSVEKKQPQALSINADFGQIHSLGVVDRKAYLLGSSGLYEVSLPLDVQGKIVASASASWQDPRLLGGFGKNVYVLDPLARQLLRYDREDFSASPAAWLRGKQGVELEAITSLAIDGDVWMGTTQGDLYRFSRGERVNFRYQDIVSPPSSNISIYTSAALPSLYILEPRANRILIIDKSGTYQSVVVSPDLAGATALIVDDMGKHAYVISGSLVYDVEL